MNLSTHPLFTHDIDILCTICHAILKDAGSSHSIFTTSEELESPMNVLQILQSFSNFNFYNGLQSQMVCTKCYEKTIEVYKFIQKCNKAHDNMQHYLKNIEAIKTIKDGTDVDVKVEQEISIAPTRIIIDGRNLLEDMKNEEITKFDELGMVISGTEIKIEERILKEEDNEEITISHTEIVTEETHNSQLALISKNLRLNRQGGHRHQPLTDVLCLECQEVFCNDKQLKIHMRRSHKKKFLCNDCGKVFTRKSTLNTHIHVHTGEKSFTCSLCKRGFAALSSLRNHMNSHNGVKAYRCEQCDRRFTQASNLRTHMAIHNGVKAYKCEQCDRRFTQAAHLRSHMDIHNGVKAHKCEQCDRPFTHVSALRRHMNSHNGVKAHTCEQCDRRFTQASDLRRHMDIHSGIKAHKCEQCDRLFTQASNLRSHMIIHNGVSPHKCEQCDRQFTQAAKLRIHMDSHNGIKAHKCEQCDRRFTQASSLRTHMMLIHNTESPTDSHRQ